MWLCQCVYSLKNILFSGVNAEQDQLLRQFLHSVYSTRLFTRCLNKYLTLLFDLSLVWSLGRWQHNDAFNLCALTKWAINIHPADIIGTCMAQCSKNPSSFSWIGSITCTHLRRFVPHVGNVLVLAVVLRPGTCQVRASERALWGPQLDAMTGDREENEEQERSDGEEEEEGDTPEDSLRQVWKVKATDAVWVGKTEITQPGRCKQGICQQHTAKHKGQSADTQLACRINMQQSCFICWALCVGFQFDVNPSCAGSSGYTLPQISHSPCLMVLRQLMKRGSVGSEGRCWLLPHRSWFCAWSSDIYGLGTPSYSFALKIKCK